MKRSFKVEASEVCASTKSSDLSNLKALKQYLLECIDLLELLSDDAFDSADGHAMYDDLYIYVREVDTCINMYR